MQQFVTAGHPSRIADLLRFANREDTSNVQYSLRKLIKTRFFRQLKGTTNCNWPMPRPNKVTASHLDSWHYGISS